MIFTYIYLIQLINIACLTPSSCLKLFQISLIIIIIILLLLLIIISFNNMSLTKLTNFHFLSLKYYIWFGVPCFTLLLFLYSLPHYSLSELHSVHLCKREKKWGFPPFWVEFSLPPSSSSPHGSCKSPFWQIYRICLKEFTFHVVFGFWMLAFVLSILFSIVGCGFLFSRLGFQDSM